MAWNDTEIIRAVRARIAEPLTNRAITDVEIRAWYNEELKDLSREIKFLKQAYSVVGSDNVTADAAFDTELNYYTPPDGFLSFDPQYGIRTNGLSRFPTTDREMRAFEAKGQAGTTDDTMYVDDYFNLAYVDILSHYGTDFIFKTEVDSGRQGGLFWFFPNPAAADVIRYRCVIEHPDVASDADTVYWPEHFKDVVILSAAIKGLENLLAASGSYYPVNNVAWFEQKYKQKRTEAVEYFTDSNKVKKRYRVKTPRMLGMYNSRRETWAKTRRECD